MGKLKGPVGDYGIFFLGKTHVNDVMPENQDLFMANQ